MSAVTTRFRSAPSLLAIALSVTGGAHAQNHAHGHEHGHGGQAHAETSHGQAPSAAHGSSAHRQHPPAGSTHEGKGDHRAAEGQASRHAGIGHATHATHAGHSGHAQDPATPAEMQSADTTEAATDHAAMDHSGMDHSGMDHSGMDHGSGHATTQVPGHAGHGQATAQTDLPTDAPPRDPIPALTDADRAAAFPALHPHAMGDSAVRSFVRVDRLEGFEADHGRGLGWEVDGWIGGDVHRLWLKTGGERVGGRTHDASFDALYGRSVSPWWDVVAGAHHVFAPGRAKTYASVGVQGLAPYLFEVSAMAHVDGGGRVLAELEVEYEMLLTNRLILQPALEISAASESDPARHIGSGLGGIEAGLRLRYEFTRRFAPYVGIVHERSFGETRALEQADGGSGRETRWVIGVRTWF
ncbi:copper resistance protein B [Luteimonas sp. FCS-9]|uniref:copper resistance protein B n=1 Tax=Luteimonas sp. FCS-9 TaxID=1547516 RepID=UPI00063E99B9|nr:copper resistance protein B [Luteimonas sp. FCS-9]KLJ02124.1 hypothetical protein WQ56_04710 [Luteimonas sp. FCS-9]